MGSYGETISQTSRWIDGGTAGATFASVTFSDFDDARRWRRMDLVDGTYETRTFDCCGLGLITDRDGVTTQLLYDAEGHWGQICPFDKSSSGPKALRIDGFVPWHRVGNLTRFQIFGSSGD